MIETCGIASSFFADAKRAVRTWPDLREWRQTLALFVLFLVFATLANRVEYLFNFSAPDDWASLLAIAALALAVPAFAEEMVFRVILASRAGWWRCGIALVLFVVWHPVQVWLGLPMAQPVFLEPGFLAVVAGLGLVCTIAYRRTGSIWPAVAIHWGTVVLWKAVASG